MKKLTSRIEFDKRTSLGALGMYHHMIDIDALSTQAMAKSMCARISNEILAIVPQLNDYLCPVCFSISYKPVRLQCGHVFCIRCLVVMQRSQQTHCPLCRGDVVMLADSGKLGNSVADPSALTWISQPGLSSDEFPEGLLPC